MTETTPPNNDTTLTSDFARAKFVASRVTATLASFFSTPIRAIRLEYLRSLKKNWDNEKIWQSCSFLVGVSPTIKTVLYHAAKAFYPKQFESIGELNTKNLTLLFKPDDLATLIALVYVHRSLKKHFEPSGWRRVEEDAFTAMLISSAVGETVQHMSRGDAMLQGGLRVFAQAALTLFGKELPPLEKVPSHRSKTKQSTPEQRELSKYGCTHLQVAAQLAQTLGFGADIGSCIATPLGDRAALPEYLRQRAASWSATRIIADSYQAFGHAPEVSEDSELYLNAEENGNLTGLVNKLLEDELPKYWISSRPEELDESIRNALQLEIKQTVKADSLEDEIPAIPLPEIPLPEENS